LLGVPSGVVINRSMGDDDSIRDFCRARKLPVLTTIPFDRDIAETVNSGQLLTDRMPIMRGQFRELFSRACVLTGV